MKKKKRDMSGKEEHQITPSTFQNIGPSIVF